MPEQPKTLSEFRDVIKNNQLVAVDFTASWCGPCQFIGPKFVEFEKDPQFSAIKFIKIDVDENSETSEEYDVTAMPTFKFFKDGAEVTTLGVVGASEANLKASLSKLAA